MAIPAEKIKPVGEKIIADLQAKIGGNGAAKWEFRRSEIVKTPSGNPVKKLVKYELTANEFLETLQKGSLPQSMQRKETTPFDNPLFKLYRPAFKHKDWLHATIDALDELNLTAVKDNNGGAVPDGVFEDAELAQYATQARFACGDAGQFSQVISNDSDYYYLNQVLNRVYRAEADTKRAPKAKAAQEASPGDISELSAADYVSSARKVYTNTNEARSGICTTFAWTAAYPLLDRMLKRQTKKDLGAQGLQRVEVVAYTNHIFVIVNREGDALEINEELPPPGDWNDDVIQVDLWLGTLGWPWIYSGKSGDNEGFLEPLKSLFDSKHVGWK